MQNCSPIAKFCGNRVSLPKVIDIHSVILVARPFYSTNTIPSLLDLRSILRQKKAKNGLPQTVYPCFDINHHINKQGPQHLWFPTLCMLLHS